LKPGDKRMTNHRGAEVLNVGVFYPLGILILCASVVKREKGYFFAL
jgi:hypothetical protein